MLLQFFSHDIVSYDPHTDFSIEPIKAEEHQVSTGKEVSFHSDGFLNIQYKFLQL